MRSSDPVPRRRRSADAGPIATDRMRQARPAWNRVVLGVALVGLLVGGCAERETPSEATAEPTTAASFSAATGTPPGQLRRIAVLDDCLPTDPGWEPIGGCVLADGQVSVAEFDAALPQGHPAWRNDPAYAKATLRGRAFRNIEVTNEGGREHTFTRVAQFGAGVVPPLNPPGQAPAPECTDPASFGASFLPPGGSRVIASLEPGVHRYQCCIHPWMRTELRVD